MRRTPTILLVIVAAVTGLGCGNGLPSTPLGNSRSEVDAVFAQYDRPDSPGCALGLIQDGEFVYRRGYGMADLEHDVPLDADSVFRVGSVSKQFTAMVVLLLQQAGELALDDDIRTWLPEMPEFDGTVTIRHLLHHTSGVRDYLVLLSLAGYRDEDFYTAPELLGFLSRQRDLNYPPGTDFLYSNSGYFLLGQIVERVTGRTLAKVAKELIFDPLQMTDTHFHDDATRIVPRRALGYARAEGAGFVISMTTLPIVGDGGVFTSVNDLLAWERNFYDNRLGQGGNELIEQWLQPGVLDNGKTIRYSAGIIDGTYRGLRTVGHGGSFVGFRAEMVSFPEQRFSIITLCNLASARPRQLSRRVADTQLAEFLEPPEEQPAAPTDTRDPDAEADEFLLSVSELRRYEGRFASSELDIEYEVLVRDGHLSYRVPQQPDGWLRARPGDHFESDDGQVEIRFAADSQGRVTGFLLDAGRVRNLWFARVH